MPQVQVTEEDEVALDPTNRSYRDVVDAFHEIAEALSETRELDPLLGQIADRVCSLLGAARCSIHLRDETAGLYRGRVANTSQAIDDRVKRLVLGMAADRFTQEIVETKKPVVLANAVSDPRAVRSAMRAWSTQSVMGVPMILHDEVIGLMIIDDGPRRMAFPQVAQDLGMAFAGLAASAIDQAQLNARHRTALETVARQNRLLRRASGLEEELSALLIDGSGLQGTVDLVSKTTTKPSAIYTADLKRVVTSQLETGPSRMPVELFDAAQNASSGALRALAEMQAKPAEILGPFAAIGLHHRYLVAPIRREAAIWGYLVISEHASRLGALDGAIARRAATNIAVELSMQRRSIGDSWEAYESLVMVLVRATHSGEWLQRRADYLGVRLDARRVVCVVAPTRDGVALPGAAEISERLGDIGGAPRAIGTDVDGKTVMLVETGSLAEDGSELGVVSEALAGALSSLGASDGVIAAVSREQSTAVGLRSAYDEALQVAETGRRHLVPNDNVVITAGEIGVGRILLASMTPEEAKRLVEDTLGSLAYARTAKARELLVTLSAFLSSRIVSETGKRLMVHENTVRYRLARIEQLTGLDVLADPDDQMAAYLAVLVLRITGALPSAEPVGRAIRPATASL